MENDQFYINFLNTWHQVMIVASILFISLAIIIYIYHKLKTASIADYKSKYDYINLNEIKLYRLAFIFVGIAAACFANMYDDDTVSISILWFFVRFFVAICIGTLVGYVSALILKFYYPSKVQKKLEKWRYMPRINPDTGNKMKLLSEDEEDVHLDEGMQAEENVFSVDYDVWIDEVTGTTKIEKYQGYLEALECGTCGFQTLKIVREEIVQPATETEEGELLKHFECSYCKSKRTTAHHIAKLNEDEGNMVKSLARKQSLKEATPVVDAVSIKLHSNNGVSKVYEFPNLDQAQQFLSNFDEENLSE